MYEWEVIHLEGGYVIDIVLYVDEDDTGLHDWSYNVKYNGSSLKRGGPFESREYVLEAAFDAVVDVESRRVGFEYYHRTLDNVSYVYIIDVSPDCRPDSFPNVLHTQLLPYSKYYKDLARIEAHNVYMRWLEKNPPPKRHTWDLLNIV